VSAIVSSEMSSSVFDVAPPGLCARAMVFVACPVMVALGCMSAGRVLGEPQTSPGVGSPQTVSPRFGMAPLLRFKCSGVDVVVSVMGAVVALVLSSVVK